MLHIPGFASKANVIGYDFACDSCHMSYAAATAAVLSSSTPQSWQHRWPFSVSFIKKSIADKPFAITNL
jgi:hypothetical protein